jgi:uncharacterized small protein (DUF1192 family)
MGKSQEDIIYEEIIRLCRVLEKCKNRIAKLQDEIFKLESQTTENFNV